MFAKRCIYLCDVALKMTGNIHKTIYGYSCIMLFNFCQMVVHVFLVGPERTAVKVSVDQLLIYNLFPTSLFLVTDVSPGVSVICLV